MARGKLYVPTSRPAPQSTAGALVEMTTIEFALGGTLKFLVEPEARAGAIITISYDGLTLTAWGDGMAYKLPNDMQVNVKVSYVDAKGNPAMVDGDVEWDSSDATIVAVHVNPDDSQNAAVVPTGKTGQVQVTATADADLGSGVRELVTIMDVEVLAGEAVAGTIEPVGDPVPIPPL
jgi:hypothetical protein